MSLISLSLGCIHSNLTRSSVSGLPENMATDMASLIKKYHNLPMISIEDILDFHVQFERIHPFQDGNGKVGRLIMFKECLKHNHVPFIISDDMKYFYYRSLSKWRDQTKWFLA